MGSRLFAGFGEWYRWEAAQAHLALLTDNRHTKHPASGSGLSDLQGQPVHTADAPAPRLRQAPYLKR
jgi:hypothetical protein